mgnify:FL=1
MPFIKAAVVIETLTVTAFKRVRNFLVVLLKIVLNNKILLFLPHIQLLVLFEIVISSEILTDPNAAHLHQRPKLSSLHFVKVVVELI